MPDLTIRQLSVLRFLQRYHEQTGLYATLRVICKEFGWTSPSTAHQHVLALETQGFVERKQITNNTFVYFVTDRWWERQRAVEKERERERKRV